jgi:dihydroflavonol-4-reductase
MARVLVTGATGFIGSHTVRALQARGTAVRVIVRDPAKLADVGLDARTLDVVAGDLTKPADCDRAMRGAAAVIHIAGLVSTKRADIERLHTANVVATRMIMEAAARAVVPRVVHLASIFALGGGTVTPLNEASAYNLADWRVPYFRAKRESDGLVETLARDGLPVVFAYPGFCYGPGDVYASSTEIVTSFLKHEVPAYIPGGQNAMDVRDAAEGLLLALERGTPGERYIIGGENVTYAELFQRLARLTGLAAPRRTIPRWLGVTAGWVGERVLPSFPLDANAARVMGAHWYYDDAKARTQLGYSPRPLDTALIDTIRWNCERGLAPWPKTLETTAS